MASFQFSPITDKEQLVDALTYIHAACHALCMQSLGQYLPVAGNIGVFCHFDEEYLRLTRIQQQLTDPADPVYGKYFKLHEPIHIAENNGIPEATYTHLYIRKPDPGKPQTGDLDFYMEPSSFTQLKQSVANGGNDHGMRILNRPDLDLVELYDTDSDALGYIGTKLFR